MRTSERHDVSLRSRVACPNCMAAFDPGDVLFMAEHTSLHGDPIAGEDEPRRFRPSRFTIDGNAVDPLGMECHRLACPHCHVQVSRALLQYRSLHVGLVGGPGTGKSYLLASMTRMLRRQLISMNVSLEEPAPELNIGLHEYERTLFMPPSPDEHVHLEKTELTGLSIYQRVEYAGHSHLVARPFQFLMSRRDRPRSESILTMLYDTAGEYFLPGSDRGGIQVTRNLALAPALMVMFDLLQDTQCLAALANATGSRGDHGGTALQQDAIIHELVSRIARFSSMESESPRRRRVIIVLPKADAWYEPLIGEPLPAEPFVASEHGGRQILNHTEVRRVHRLVRKRLGELCPEFIATMQTLGEQPIFIPTSAIGRAPERLEVGGGTRYAVKSSDIAPQWTTVPILYALASTGSGIVDSPSRGTSS